MADFELLWELCLLLGAKSCKQLRDDGNTKSGIYTITFENNESVRVYCDMDKEAGGYLVFQRRQDGTVDFYRGWDDYTNGFGQPTGEFWIGNKYLHELTKNVKHELRIDLWDQNGNHRYAKYTDFSIGPESDYFSLRYNLASYSGDAGDSLYTHNGRAFSTKDKDLDAWGDHCSRAHHGAWWYNACATSNLNGHYGDNTNAKGVNWYTWRGSSYSLKKTEMKIRVM